MSPKRYILKVIIFSLPLVTFFYSFSWWIAQQPSELLYKKQTLTKKLLTTDTLILGQADAYQGIDARALSEHAFNLATPGQSLILDAKLAKQYVPQLKKINTVVFTLSPIAYNSKVDDSAGSLKPFLYRRYFGVSEEDADWDPSLGLNVLGFFRNENALRMVYDGLTKKRWAPMMDEWGSAVSDASTQSASPLKPAKFSKSDWDHFESTLKSLRKKKVNVFFVSLPTREEQTEQIFRITYKLSEKYDIPYFNYAKDDRISRSDLTQEGLLGREGRIRFTQILKHDIETELKKRQPEPIKASGETVFNVWSPDLSYFPRNNQAKQS